MIDLEKWKDPRLELELRAWAIDPWSLDSVVCEIPDVIESGCSITEGYYSDTRISASIKVLDPFFPEGSWIRLEARDSNGGIEELGTFVITDIETEETESGTVAEYELQSVIWAISEDRCGYHWAIGSGAMASSAISAVMEAIGKEHVFLGGFSDAPFSAAYVYEIGDPFMSVLFDICDKSGNRMDVDGHGRITFDKYVSPRDRGADWFIDERDSRSIVLDSDLKEKNPVGESYDRSIVTWSGTPDGEENEIEVTAQANVDASASNSRARRGYSRANVHSESEAIGYVQAEALAKKYLVDDSDSKREITRKLMWVPMHEGDMVELVKMDGTKGMWLVKTIDADMGDWTKSVTLKEVS